MKLKLIAVILITILLCSSSFLIVEASALVSTRKDAVVKYILNLQEDKKGFKPFLEAKPNIKATFEALSILKLLNKFGKIKKNKIVEWINETLIVHDSSSENYSLIKYEQDGDITIYSNYFGLKTFILLDEDYTEYLEEDYIVDWTAKCNTDNLYSIYPNGTEKALWTTYYALSIIYLLNKTLWNIISYNLTEWLVSLQNPDGGFSLEENVSVLSETYAAVKLLDMAQALQDGKINKEKLISWVLDRMLPNGCFEEILGSSVGSLFTTYLAIDILNTVDALDQLGDNRSKVINWILSCQRTSGGFSLVNSTARESIVTDEATIEATFYAISTLHLLDPDFSSLTERPWWGLPLGLPLHLWILLAVIAVVVILLIVHLKFGKL
ncbi:MAG: prenyltransferase/squalene oxidase repeat-containing protein [Candidatus Baldrarchaeia archaeon]